MTTTTDEEWQHLYENFETTQLLRAVKAVDNFRDDLNEQVRHMMTGLEQIHGTLAKMVVLYPESLDSNGGP